MSTRIQQQSDWKPGQTVGRRWSDYPRPPAAANTHDHKALTPARIFAETERGMERLEDAFGFGELSSFIDTYYTHAERSNVIDEYRLLIRDNDWHHGSPPQPSHGDFLVESLAVSVEYVSGAFFALDFLSGRHPITLAEAHRRCWAAESLRGQVGKRSAWGLDARLEARSQALVQLLGAVADQGWDVEECLYPLCTPTTAPFCAETMLVEDFATLRRFYPEPPSRGQLRRRGRAAERAARRFLRRHCRWSSVQMEAWYSELESVDEDHLRDLRVGRGLVASERTELLSQISTSADREASERIKALSSEVLDLNQLNLAFDPCFSFKGGTGLLHWGVFATAQRSSPATSIHLRQLDLEKAPVSERHLSGRVLHQQKGR